MTFLTLWRFHPINRATTAVIDIACLSAMGFPQWSITVVFAVRHYYGQFIHADVPWTYGPLKYLFVSPVMHRWHHAVNVVRSMNAFASMGKYHNMAHAKLDAITEKRRRTEAKAEEAAGLLVTSKSCDVF